MINRNYGLAQANKISENVERVKSEDLEIFIATKRPMYNEGDNNRPNFYDKILYHFENNPYPTWDPKVQYEVGDYVTSSLAPFDAYMCTWRDLNFPDPAQSPNKWKKVDARPAIDLPTHIKRNITRYEADDLRLRKINSKSVIAAFNVDNDKMVITIKPYDLIKEGIASSYNDLFALNYIRVTNKETDEVKYFWINDFKTNESRNKSSTLILTMDYWMTYYLDVMTNVKGDIKVLKKHYDRFKVIDRFISNHYPQWIPETSYLIGVKCEYLGISYECTSNNHGSVPSTSPFFKVIPPLADTVLKDFKNDYSLDNPIWNIESKDMGLSNNLISSLGFQSVPSAPSGETDFTINDNKVIVEFNVIDLDLKYVHNGGAIIPDSHNYPIPPVEKTIQEFIADYGINHISKYQYDVLVLATHKYQYNSYAKVSSYLSSWTQYDKSGKLIVPSTTIAPKNIISYDEATGQAKYDFKATPIFKWNSFTNETYASGTGECYGPKTLSSLGIKPNFIYIKKNEVDASFGEHQQDAYGILLSEVNLAKDGKLAKSIINRIDNVDNGWIKGSLPYVPTIRASADWRWAVLNDGDTVLRARQGTYANHSSAGSTRFSTKQLKSSTEGLKLYLVDYNTRTEYGKYTTKIDVGGFVSHSIASRNFYYQGTNRDQETSFSYITRGATSEAKSQQKLHDGTVRPETHYNSVSIIPEATLVIKFNGDGDNETSYFGELNMGQVDTIRTFGSSNVSKPIELLQDGNISISNWNKKAQTKQLANNKISLKQENYNLKNTLELGFQDVLYKEISPWTWSSEPQIKMSHSVKHFIDYLGVRKQIFLELGNIKSITKLQIILPNRCIEKIYWEDVNTDENAWELSNTNGFLEKIYDNSIPSVTDAFTSYLTNSQSSMEASFYSANQNLEFTKHQTSINNQQNSLNNAKDIVGVGSSMIGSGLSIAGGAATGNPMAIAGGIASAGNSSANALFMGQQINLNNQQNALSNAKAMFSAEQGIRNLNAGIKDIYNQSDQLNTGSSEVNSIIRYKQELSALFVNYGETGASVDFKIDTSAPTLLELKNYSMDLHREGYVSNKVHINSDINLFSNRMNFNYVQLEQLSPSIRKNLPINALNYFDSIFNSGVRLWNVNRIKINDYSMENWEVEIVEGMKQDA